MSVVGWKAVVASDAHDDELMESRAMIVVSVGASKPY